MGERSGSENRRLRRHVNLRVDERSYQLIEDAARQTNLEIAGWLRVVLSREIDQLSSLPVRKPTARAPLPVDLLALKSLTAHVGQLCGAIMMLLGRDRLPLASIGRNELRLLHDELLAIKGQLLKLLAELTR